MKRKRKNIPAGVRWDVFQRDDFRCVYCGATKKDGAQLVVDHGDPFSRGGEDSIENGSPWMFFAAVVTDRRKGCPDGFVIDEWLEVGDEFYSSGWYPDESWECVDPRDDFGMRRPTSLSLRGWHITMNDIDMEGSDDI